MSQLIQAIYEKGVLRPLQPLDLNEHDVVSISIEGTQASPNKEADEIEGTQASPKEADEVDTLGRHREALSRLRKDMDQMPVLSRDDGFSGADHDKLLYGSPP